MARPRRIIVPLPEVKPEPPSKYDPALFLACTFGVVPGKHELEFAALDGKRLSIALDDHAWSLWRRFTRGNI